MSDEAQEMQVEEVPEIVEVEPEVPLDPQTALFRVIQTSLHHNGLARGLRESVKVLDRGTAHLCVLAANCEEAAYTKLITALCTEKKVPLIKVEDRKTIGEWAGLCIRDAEGKARKIRGASCCVIEMWGEETPARAYILEHLSSA